ncbi:MAG: Zn-ribbon containing protein [Nanoarchaeota archaeon]
MHCGKVFADGSKELIAGCSCGSHFFYFIKKEYYEKLTQKVKEDLDPQINKELSELKTTLAEINKVDKAKMEKDVREIIGVSEQEEVPVILDLESIRVIKPGKFEIDIVNLFNKKRPLIYKLEEGKYIIDLASTLKLNAEQLNEKIKHPEKLGR